MSEDRWENIRLFYSQQMEQLRVVKQEQFHTMNWTGAVLGAVAVGEAALLSRTHVAALPLFWLGVVLLFLIGFVWFYAVRSLGNACWQYAEIARVLCTVHWLMGLFDDGMPLDKAIHPDVPDWKKWGHLSPEYNVRAKMWSLGQSWRCVRLAYTKATSHAVCLTVWAVVVALLPFAFLVFDP